MPEGGTEGYYSNWFNEGRGGPPAWQTFHLTELIQVLERDWRASDHRAVAGLSMGGLGAMLYAAHSPHLFRAAASFSGVLDTLSTTDWQFPPEAWGNRTQQAKVWRQHNPTDRAADLRGISLFVSYGHGDPGPLDAARTATSGVGGQIERRLTPGNAAFVRRLAKLGIPAGSTRTGPASTTGRTGNGNCTVRCPASCVPYSPDLCERNGPVDRHDQTSNSPTRTTTAAAQKVRADKNDGDATAATSTEVSPTLPDPSTALTT